MRIQNNIAALNSHRVLSANTTLMNKSLERLSSGYRINTASDDAAGMAASMRFRSEISSLKVASRNAAEATSLLQVSEGAMGQIDLILNRMKELATQAASANAGDDLSKIDAESTALESEIGRIVSFTKYGGKTLLDGSFGATTLTSVAITGFTSANGIENIDVSNAAAESIFYVSAMDTTNNLMTISQAPTSTGLAVKSQTIDYTAAVGMGVNEDYTLNFSDLGVKITVNSEFAEGDYTAGTTTTGSHFQTDVLGQSTFQIGTENASSSQMAFNLSDLSLSVLANGSSADIDLSSQTTAQAALATIDDAISYLASKRGDVGALVNRLTYAQSNLSVSVENKTASESVIRDVDMASEMSQFTKSQILVQSSIAMLAQANVAPQNIIQLL